MSTFIFRAHASEVEKETIDNILSLSQKTFLNSTVYTFLLKYFIDSHENLRTQFSNSVDSVLGFTENKKNILNSMSGHGHRPSMANMKWM